MIIDGTGEIRELEGNWCQVGPLELDREWTGWIEFTLIEEGEKTEDDELMPMIRPPPSAAVKRGPEEMNGEIDPSDQQAEQIAHVRP